MLRAPERASSGRFARPFTLAVASGKGGTGKTLVATNLAVMAAQSGLATVLADCDVEAPNDHLFLSVQEPDTQEVTAIVAQVQTEYCTGCGAAKGACNFGALRLMGNKAVIFEELCHGCGKCGWICPVGAIREESRRVGETVAGVCHERDNLTLVTGRLDVGGVKTPNVIRAARAEARAIEADFTILDAPPGVACASVAATRGAAAMLHVTEPTAFGVHDLELSLELAGELGVPSAILVNRGGADDANVRSLAKAWDAPIVATIPFEREIAETYARGGLLTGHSAVEGALEAVLAWGARVSEASQSVEVAS